MKKRVSRVLSIALILCMLLTQTALAATSYYIDISIQGPDAKGVTQTVKSSSSKYSTLTTPLATEVATSVQSHYDELETVFAGTGLRKIVDQGLEAFWSSEEGAWDEYVDQYYDSVDNAFKDTLKDKSSTLGDLTVDKANQITFTTKNGNLYTVTVTLQSYSTTSGGGGGGGSVGTSYKLTFNTNGGSEISPVSKSSGTIIDLSAYVPTRDGYTFEGWCSDSSLSTRVTSVTLTGNVTVYAKWSLAVANPQDTGVSGWLNTEDHIAFLHGYTDGTFGPNRNMTRAEVAQMFYNLLLNKEVASDVEYTDVKDGDWYAPAVRTLSGLGIITGYTDGTFKPYKAVTRAEFTMIAMRFGKLDNSGENIFTDVQESDWYYEAIIGSVKYGWINGYDDGTFRPNASISRAGVATIVNHMLGRSADKSFVDTNADDVVHFQDLADSYWAYYDIMEATNGHDYQANQNTETWKTLQ